MNILQEHQAPQLQGQSIEEREEELLWGGDSDKSPAEGFDEEGRPQLGELLDEAEGTAAKSEM